MALILEIRAIIFDIKAITITIDIALRTLIKALYPTYSTYLESLQASGQLGSLTFNTLSENITKR